jgi:hypothetical protein
LEFFITRFCVIPILKFQAYNLIVFTVFLLSEGFTLVFDVRGFQPLIAWQSFLFSERAAKYGSQPEGLIQQKIGHRPFLKETPTLLNQPDGLPHFGIFHYPFLCYSLFEVSGL